MEVDTGVPVAVFPFCIYSDYSVVVGNGLSDLFFCFSDGVVMNGFSFGLLTKRFILLE